jgi:hypothetical protein
MVRYLEEDPGRSTKEAERHSLVEIHVTHEKGKGRHSAIGYQAREEMRRH